MFPGSFSPPFNGKVPITAGITGTGFLSAWRVPSKGHRVAFLPFPSCWDSHFIASGNRVQRAKFCLQSHHWWKNQGFELKLFSGSFYAHLSLLACFDENSKANKCWERCRVKGTLIVENINQHMEKKRQRFIKISSLELAYDPEIPLLGRQRREQN